MRLGKRQIYALSVIEDGPQHWRALDLTEAGRQRLVDLGLAARSFDHWLGITYAITPAGREALKKWREKG